MKDRFLYIYYFSLILVLALYTNMSSSPNVVIRFGYLAALVLPLVKRTELFPAVIICALGIAKNTFAYPLMPTDMYYYVILALLFAIMALSRRDFLTGTNPLFFIALVYVAFNDIAMQGELSQMSIVFFVSILFFMCMEGQEDDIGIQILPFSFILISLVISYWVLFCPEAQVNSYNKTGEMEQRGWADPNYLSAVLGMGLVVAVRDLFIGSNKRLYTSVLLLTVLGSSIAMLALASRGAILSVIMAVVALLVLSKTENRTKVIAIALATLFIWFLYTNQYIDFVMSRFEASDGTGSNRTLIWYSKLSDFFALDNPFCWLFGVGQSEGVKLGLSFGKAIHGMSTHNDFLSILIYYGLIGVFMFFSILTYLFKMCSKEDRPPIIALLVYLLMCSMTIEPLAHGNFVYWGFLFYIVMLARQSQAMELIDEGEEEFVYEDEEQD